MFKNVFSFDGRIRRTEYGVSYLIYLLVSWGMDWVLTANIQDETIHLITTLAIYIFLFWLLLAQGAKRCHDLGNTGWFQIIPFYFLWMLFADSKFGPNEYGDNPKGEGNYDEIDALGEHLGK